MEIRLTTVEEIGKLSALHFKEVLQFGCVPTHIDIKKGVVEAAAYKDLWFPCSLGDEIKMAKEILKLHRYLLPTDEILVELARHSNPSVGKTVNDYLITIKPE